MLALCAFAFDHGSVTVSTVSHRISLIPSSCINEYCSHYDSYGIPTFLLYTHSRHKRAIQPSEIRVRVRYLWLRSTSFIAEDTVLERCQKIARKFLLGTLGNIALGNKPLEFGADAGQSPRGRCRSGNCVHRNRPAGFWIGMLIF